MAEKRPRTERSESEMDPEGGEEAMTNIYLTDSDEEAVVDFVKDHEELHHKTNEHFKDKSRKDCLWERFASSQILSVRVCKTWFESQRTRYGKLTQSKSGQAPKEIAERQNWLQDKFNLIKDPHQKGLSKSSGFKSPQRGASTSAASAHDILRWSTDTDSMKISIHSDTTHQPSICSTASTSVVSQPPSS